jgi:hypothetical protein
MNRIKCWTTPTTYLERLGDALELLCVGNRPNDELIIRYLDNNFDGYELQEFCITHCPLVWSQGIVVIDAAMVLANSPGEGVEHEIIS